MGSCEIVEEDKDVTKHKNPALGSSQEFDIDKLLKSVTLRPMGSSSFHHLETSSSSVSAGPSRNTSPSNTYALRKSLPTRSPRVVGGSNGSSDSISLKQALRDLCVSKASEMAAQKRLTKSATASPRVSEADRIKTLYSQVLCGLETELSNSVSEPSGSCFSSPSGDFERDEIVTSSHVVTEDEIDKHVTCPDTKELDKSIVSASRFNNETTENSNKVRRTIPRPKKKILLKKKLKIALATTKILDDDNTPLEPSESQLLCQRCHCAMSQLTNENYVSVEESHTSPRFINDVKKSDKEANKDSSDSCEISNSIGDYTSSTSMSEESNLSNRFSCNNKPHMSMDVRWEAIKHVKLQHGSLGLRHFNLLKKLGCGDIGTVYLAELVGTNCLFAIKVMDIEFLARRKKTPRAQAERVILKMLDHPFLPTLYAQFTSDNLSCLVMEYCPGGDLHVLRQKQLTRCFPEPAARFYVAEVLLALEYLHMLGVIYRDLKPENILVREDGHIMLTDFDLSLTCATSPTLLRSSSSTIKDQARLSSGPYNNTSSSCIQPLCIEPSCFSPKLRKPKRPDLLSQQFRSLPQLVAEPTEARSNSFVGTHEYLAPEIIKGEGHGAAVDWWTFGVLLYELLYGKTPFKGYDNEETLSNVVFHSLEFPDGPLVGFQAKELIRKLLVKDPERRLGTVKGAAEIKRHPFFEGLNWALIRCAIPPELPDSVVPATEPASPEGSNGYLECKAIGDHLEFEFF